MRRFLVMFLVLCAGIAGAFPVSTNDVAVEVTDYETQSFRIPQGELRYFLFDFQENGVDMVLTNLTADLLYQGGTMTNWASITGSVVNTNQVLVPWGPDYDLGYSRYTGWLRLRDGSLNPAYRLKIDLRMIKTPGFVVNPIAVSIVPVDFALLSYTNEPWVSTNDVDGTTIVWTNGALTAIAPASPDLVARASIVVLESATNDLNGRVTTLEGTTNAFATAMDQGVATNDSPTFDGLRVTENASNTTQAVNYQTMTGMNYAVTSQNNVFSSGPFASYTTNIFKGTLTGERLGVNIEFLGDNEYEPGRYGQGSINIGSYSVSDTFGLTQIIASQNSLGMYFVYVVSNTPVAEGVSSLWTGGDNVWSFGDPSNPLFSAGGTLSNFHARINSGTITNDAEEGTDIVNYRTMTGYAVSTNHTGNVSVSGNITAGSADITSALTAGSVSSDSYAITSNRTAIAAATQIGTNATYDISYANGAYQVFGFSSANDLTITFTAPPTGYRASTEVVFTNYTYRAVTWPTNNTTWINTEPTGAYARVAIDWDDVNGTVKAALINTTVTGE